MSTPFTISLDDLENPEEGAVWRRMPRSRVLRRTLRLSIEQFGERYRIPVETLRAWEAGTATPDVVAEAYLRAIAGNPDAVATALEAGQRAAAE